MSTFNNFLSVVNGLPSGTAFMVTYHWCVSQGLTLTPSIAKIWGKSFAQCYSQYNTIYLGKGTNNLRNYRKI